VTPDRAPASATPPAPGRDHSGLAAVVFAGLGLLVSAYLSVEHYRGSASLACPDTGGINCVKVTTSRWAEVAGVPVAVLGFGYFVAMTALVVPPSWRRRRLGPIRVAGAATGALAVVYLVYIELFQVDALCLWCTAVHTCALVLFALVLARDVGRAPNSP
jgi:uncharacterized membrane protein